MNELLSGLNTKQQEAVLATEGPVLILAGAGSGKTKTLVHRIAHIIASKKARASDILALTFTNKAAGEMKHRILSLLRTMPHEQRMSGEPTMGTFHSICARMLRNDIEALGYKRSFTIYDQDDAISLVRTIMKGLDFSTQKISPRSVLHFISSAKNELKTPREATTKIKSYAEEVACKIFEEYERQLKHNHALDFDDLINKTIELFKLPRDGAEKGGYYFLEKYQERFRYILVDEYQDTNFSQYTLINLLAGKYRNICVVGDDWQGIYSFRGADIRNILDFENDYPETKVVLLEQNYRSTKNIVEASNFIIKGNGRQKDKNLWTENKQGEKIEVHEVFDEKAEAEFVIETILGRRQPEQNRSVTTPDGITYEEEEQSPRGILDTIMASDSFQNKQRKKPAPEITYQREGTPEELETVDLNKYVVLYRTNAQSRALEEALLRYGIPYRIVGGIKFYERKEIKDILAYLRILVNENDTLSLQRIINAPPRGIGDRSFEILKNWALQNNQNIFAALKTARTTTGISAKAAHASVLLSESITEIKNEIERKKLSELIDLVPIRTGYKEMILDGTLEGESRWANIQELKSVAVKYDHLHGAEALGSFLEEVALLSHEETTESTSGALTLMTVHAAKGLEFSHVFLVGMEEGIFPHSQSIFQPGEMDEERRLCYVAMTRAKERLYMMYTCQRRIYGHTQVSMPSRFIEDIPEKFVEKHTLSEKF